MVKVFEIDGMTCTNCVAKVKKSIESIEGVLSADIGLDTPQARIEMAEKIPLIKIQEAIGHYTIRNYQVTNELMNSNTDVFDKSISTYKPLLLIVGFIIGTTFLAQYPFTDFSWMLWMRHFMAGFFIVFSFFKLLNIQGFADSYGMYDIIASKWKPWGYIYPFMELTLGILYLINFAPFLTNIITIIVLGISSIGVIKSNLDKRKIKCACLGDVFNLPMSTVTIVEDVSMVAMAVIMLFFV